MYTPFVTLSDDEFVTHIANKEDASDEEVEAMLRIERLQDELGELKERLSARYRKPETKYVTHA